MGEFYQWSHNHINYVFFIYGLSLFAMGLAISILPKKDSKFGLGKILWILALYGFFHSIADFSSIISEIKEETSNKIGLLFTSASYLFLFEFGRRTLNLSGKNIPWWTLFLCVSFSLIFSLMADDKITAANIFIGYFIRLPAGVMAGMGLIAYYQIIKDQLTNRKIKSWFYATAIAMFFWAFLCALIRVEGDFFPATYVNATAFFEFTGFPVQIFRSMCSVMVTIGIIGIMNIFKLETEQKLEQNLFELGKSRKALQKLVEERTEELTELKKTQQALADSEEKYRSFIENSHDVIWTLDTNGKVTYLNKRAEEISGYRIPEITGQHFSFKIIEADVPKVLNAVSDSLNGITQDFNVRVTDKDGRVIFLDVIQMPVFFRGKISGIIAFGRNITEQKLAAEKLQSVIETSVDGFWVTDAENGKFLEVNDAYCSISGYSKAELLTMRINDVDAIETPEETLNRIEKVIRTGHDRFETRHKTKSGKLIDVEINTTFSNLDNGRFYVFIHDISERKKAEQKLKETVKKLELANHELVQFARIASHDLQEPLRLIASYSQLVEKRYSDKLDGDAKDFLHYAVDGAARMKKLIKDIIEFSGISDHERKVAEVDIQQIVTSAVSDIHLRPGGKAATITFEKLPAIKAEPLQIASLFRHLLDNAIKFAKKTEPPQIHITSDYVNSSFIFSIKDNGIGIKSDYKEKVFTLFQRLNSVKDFAGTGIGLAVCKRIVERHSGKIWLESEENKGTTVYFSISDEH